MNKLFLELCIAVYGPWSKFKKRVKRQFGLSTFYD